MRDAAARCRASRPMPPRPPCAISRPGSASMWTPMPISGSSRSASSSGSRSFACSIRGAKILVLDEPTAVLTPPGAAGLIKTLRGHGGRGFLRHLHLAQAGRSARALPTGSRSCAVARRSARPTPGQVDRRSLARLMVGREMAAPPVDRPRARHGTALAVRETSAHQRPRPACGQRSLPRGPRRRDLRHRGRGRKWPARVRRGRSPVSGQRQRRDRSASAGAT